MGIRTRSLCVILLFTGTLAVPAVSRAGEGAAPDSAAADAAFIAQNVYLFCASEGLATVVRASIDRPALARAFGLRSTQRIALAQTVGFPR